MAFTRKDDFPATDTGSVMAPCGDSNTSRPEGFIATANALGMKGRQRGNDPNRELVVPLPLRPPPTISSETFSDDLTDSAGPVNLDEESLRKECRDSLRWPPTGDKVLATASYEPAKRLPELTQSLATTIGSNNIGGELVSLLE